MWNSTKERTKLGKINRTGIHGKSLQKKGRNWCFKKREVCDCIHIGLYKFSDANRVCVWVSLRAYLDAYCIANVYVCMHLCVCIFVAVCVCTEGSVNSHGCVGAVFSVLLLVATAKWLDKNQKDLSHSSICIQEEKSWMLSSVGWGHDPRWREQEKEDKREN